MTTVTPPLLGYQEIISTATGVTDRKRIERIEDCMRNVIFHSTLDWQTRLQLEQGARDALEVLDILDSEDGQAPGATPG
ncbi:hypothetical protein [Polaromonas sp.]|uniref:hypothetical protein n=1 Tax=Polaromonas sp. TaxID=1869339 RepID=UPI00352A2082